MPVAKTRSLPVLSSEKTENGKVGTVAKRQYVKSDTRLLAPLSADRGLLGGVEKVSAAQGAAGT